jgi:hypothetical protein
MTTIVFTTLGIAALFLLVRALYSKTITRRTVLYRKWASWMTFAIVAFEIYSIALFGRSSNLSMPWHVILMWMAPIATILTVLYLRFVTGGPFTQRFADAREVATVAMIVSLIGPVIEIFHIPL